MAIVASSYYNGYILSSNQIWRFEMSIAARQNLKVAVLHQSGFWADKQPCWEKCHCPELIRAECPATKYQFLPCWEIEGTYCKLDNHGSMGADTSICQVCRVYRKYGNGKPITLKLYGKGMNVSVNEVDSMLC
jgi:hypothetical protein